MKDILFRGMTEDGKWVEGGYCNGCEQVLDFVDGCRQWRRHYIAVDTIVNRGSSNKMLLYDVLPETIGQYTGLCDKNGVKIFEGDIVENDEDLYVVEWSEDEARFVLNGDGVQASFDNFWGYELEVIGNIYENKELLEVVK